MAHGRVMVTGPGQSSWSSVPTGVMQDLVLCLVPPEHAEQLDQGPKEDHSEKGET